VGSTASYTVSLAATATETVTLGVEGLPTNVTAAFTALTLAPGATTTLTITAAADAVAGTTGLTVTATGDTTSESVGVDLTVTTTSTSDTATDFTLAVTPTEQEMDRGGAAAVFLVATEGEGRTRIRFKVLHLRKGLKAYLSRAQAGGGETVTLTIIARRDARRGVHEFELKGTSKTGDQRVPLTLTVK